MPVSAVAPPSTLTLSETMLATTDDQRARSMSAHPAIRNRQLVERVESVHQKALEQAPLPRSSDIPTPDAGVTLTLHGDLDSDSVPQLQGVLHALVLLQPTHLSVNLSQVGRISAGALRMIERSGEAIGAWSLLDPSPSAYGSLIDLKRTEIIEPVTAVSAAELA